MQRRASNSSRLCRRWFDLAVLVLIANLIILGVLSFKDVAYAAGPYIVNSTGDDGDFQPGDGDCASDTGGTCTLRAAIEEANATPNVSFPDEIHFNIPGAGPHTIQPWSALPFISEAVVIDGSTQPGANCAAWPPTLQIEISGANAGANVTGLVFSAGGNTVRGLVINQFDIDGVFLFAGNNTFQCNFIGADVTGTIARSNGQSGIFDSGTSNNRFGGTAPGEGNLFAGHLFEPLRLAGSNSNIVQGNIVGLDVTGNTLLGASTSGILLTGSNNLVGGATPAARNLIAGANVGIDIAVGSDNTIEGNYFGVNSAGTASRPNQTGIWVNGNAFNTQVRNNLISGNTQSGVWLSGSPFQTTLQGNHIGVQADGVSPLGNGQHGIRIENGANSTIGVSGAGNIIAYNVNNGVQIEAGSGHTARGNAIFANGGLGIDLGANGIDNNDLGDEEMGVNRGQNYPVLYNAISGESTRVQAGIAGFSKREITLDFYTNSSCDATGFGEGESYLGTASVTTNSEGVALLDTSFPVATPAGRFLTATATDTSGGSTSEFAFCLPIQIDNTTWPSASLSP